MDGNGKLLTAVLLVACGALGALVFSRNEATPDRTTPPVTQGDALVRRTTPPIALDLSQDPSTGVASSYDVAAQSRSAAGDFAGHDPLRPAVPVDALPQARLTGEFGAPQLDRVAPFGRLRLTPDSDDGFEPGPNADPRAAPLQNLLDAPQLPENFPRAAPAEATTSEVTRPTLGAPVEQGASSDDAARLSAGRLTPISAPGRGTTAGAPATDGGGEVVDTAVPTEPPRRVVPVKRHTVRDGDTLVGLARRYYGDDGLATALFEANRGVLKSPELLPIGVVLTIPARELASEPQPAAATLSAPAAKLSPKPEFSPFGVPPAAAP